MKIAGKAGLDPEQLADRARRGQREIEVHTNPADLTCDPREVREMLARYGVRAVTVHAPLHAHLGNLDPAAEEEAVKQVLATAFLADAVMPEGEVRLVPVHLAPTVPVRDLDGDDAVKDRRRRELETAAESAVWLAENCRPARGPVRFCLENHALFEPGYWDPASSRFARAFCSGRFPAEFAFLAGAACSRAPAGRLGFTLDVCHAMSALAGVRVMRATGERFALVLPEDLVGTDSLEDWFDAFGPWLGVVHVSKAVGLAGDAGQHAAPLDDADVGLAVQVVDCLERVGFAGPLVIEVQEPDVRRARGTSQTARVLARAAAHRAARAAGS